jgi:hypothetical protein
VVGSQCSFCPAVEAVSEFFIEGVNFFVRCIEALDILRVLVEHFEFGLEESHEVHYRELLHVVNLGHFVQNEVEFAAELGDSVVELSVLQECFLLVVLLPVAIFLNLLQLLVLLELFFEGLVPQEVDPGNQHFEDFLLIRVYLHFLVADDFLRFKLGIVELLGFVFVYNVE